MRFCPVFSVRALLARRGAQGLPGAGRPVVSKGVQTLRGIALLVAAVTVACSRSTSKTFVYLRGDGDEDLYLELRGGDMYYLGVRQQAVCGGKYELAGAQLRLEMSSGHSLEGSILGDSLVWNHVRSETGQSLPTVEGSDPWVRLQTGSAPGWPSRPPADTTCDARVFVPILTSILTKAYVAMMKSDLRNLVTAQEQYRASRARYANTLGDLTDYVASIGVAIEITTATATGWAATATHARARDSCSIFVGPVRPPGRATKEGEPACGR